MMWGYGFNGLGWMGMGFGGLMMILVWGGLIALIFLAVRSVSGSGTGHTNQPSVGGGRSGSQALQILQERYAKGEITKAEYDEMRRDVMR